MINNVVLMGRLVADPELRNTQNCVEVASFTLAIERSYAKQGEERQADFIDCTAWRHTAAFICKYFKKGAMIAVSGEIQTRMYEDKNGNKRKAVEVVVSNASFCGGKNEGSGVSSPKPTAAPSLNVVVEDIEDDYDLPF